MLENFLEELSLRKIDWLTHLGKQYLPEGYWGGAGNSTTAGPVCLTFDDGPDPHVTPWLLDLLEASKIKATFFLIGSKVASYAHLVEKIAEAGHAIGNHSFKHPFLPLLPTAMIEREIDYTNKLIESITQTSVSLFRPPFGVMDQRGLKLLNDRQMLPVYWGAVPLDWEKPGSARVAARVMRRLSAGSLIVLHEAKHLAQQTLAAAKEIINCGHKLNFEFVSVPQLIKYDKAIPGNYLEQRSLCNQSEK